MSSSAKARGPCAVCGQPGKYRCSACQEETYCGKECQKSHWKEHRSQCGRMNGENTMVPSSKRGPCAACGQPGKYRCRACEETYCGEECQNNSWKEHWYSCGGTPKTPSSFANLLQDRPQNIASYREWSALIGEIKRTYYPEGGSAWATVRCANPHKREIEEYSPAEFNRHVIFFLTKKREKALQRMIAAIVGKEEKRNPGTALHGGELAYNVMRGWRETLLPTFNEATHPRYKFDLLYGFTAAIYRYWFWMRRHPDEWDGHQMLIDLGEMWKAMLSQGAEELGLDPVFSFPAIKVLLRKFKTDLEEERCCCQRPFAFNFE